MKKVLYVTTVSETLNAFLIPHIEMLVNEGYNVDIACNITRPIEEKLSKLVGNIHIVPFQRNPFQRDNLRAYKELKSIIKNERYDIVHTHTPVASFITRLACKGLKDTKVFYTAHGFHFYKGAPFKNWILYYTLEEWYSKYTDVLITINEEDYNLAISKKFKAKKIYKVNGVGIDLKKFTPQTDEKKLQLRSEYGFKDDDFILIYVAEMNSNKRQSFLIKVVENLKDKIPNLKLLLVGNGKLLEDYKYLAKEMNLENYVQFLGYRTDVPNLMLISDIAVSSSLREGLPVNVMEAMATGLPLIVTDCRGNRDLVKDGVNGFVVGKDDMETFASAIKNLYESKDLRNRFGKNSLELVKEYSLDKVLDEIKKIYSENF